MVCAGVAQWELISVRHSPAPEEISLAVGWPQPLCCLLAPGTAALASTREVAGSCGTEGTLCRGWGQTEPQLQLPGSVSGAAVLQNASVPPASSQVAWQGLAMQDGAAGRAGQAPEHHHRHLSLGLCRAQPGSVSPQMFWLPTSSGVHWAGGELAVGLLQSLAAVAAAVPSVCCQGTEVPRDCKSGLD